MHHFQRRLTLLSASVVGMVLACSSPIDVPSPARIGGRLGRASTGSGPTVTSALPDSASQDTTLDVQISGSGFDSGSNAAFELQGVVDSRVHVNSTKFVKSTELIATVTIAPAAIVSQYDVAGTTSSGKKGSGTDAFTVTLKNALPAWMIDATQSVNFAGDGRGDYVSGQCGISGEIYYGNYDPTTGTGGDATLSNIGAT